MIRRGGVGPLGRLLAALCLLASVATSAASGDWVDEVEGLLDAGHAESALQRVDGVLVSDPDDPLARLYRILALHELGRSTAAEAEVEDLAALDPELAAEAHLLQGLVALREGARDAALRHLERAMRLDTRGQVTRDALRALDWANRPPASRPLALHLIGGLEFDTNASQEGDLEIPGTPDDPEDGRAVLGTAVRWRPPLGERLAPYELEFGYSLYQSFHLDFAELDRRIHGAYASLSRELPHFPASTTLRLDTTFSYEDLGGDPYRHGFGLQPNLIFDWGERRGTLRLFLTGRRDTYRDGAFLPSLDRDGYELGGGADYLWSGDAGWVLGGFSYRHRNTDGRRDAGGFDAAFDRDAWVASLGGAVLLPLKLRLAVDLELQHARHPHRNVVDSLSAGENHRRRDLGFSSWLGLSRILARNLELEFGWGYADQNSNVAAYRYDRHLLGLYLHYRRE